ncbi:Sec-independent protein translocase protein TatB [Methylophilaceae bacterium]|jgi:Tat protein translocase TatB subunit|nr:Sec-independent protein translocase protein TatB [Methylophilaceae bacterium]|tara:strand:- start:3446 stop:3661 length:216 start_codon:yes stop_codon:yes gene_type:complete
MFDISFTELFIIFLVLIIFVSPKKIPMLARAGGKIIKKVKIFMSDINKEFERENKFKELKNIEKEIKKNLK